MHESSYKAGSGRRYQAGQGHPGRVPRILATVVAVIALIVGGLALVRAVAPHAIAKLTAVSVRSLAIGAAVLIVVAIILIVMARHRQAVIARQVTCSECAEHATIS